MLYTTTKCPIKENWDRFGKKNISRGGGSGRNGTKLLRESISRIS